MSRSCQQNRSSNTIPPPGLEIPVYIIQTGRVATSDSIYIASPLFHIVLLHQFQGNTYIYIYLCRRLGYYILDFQQFTRHRREFFSSTLTQGLWGCGFSLIDIVLGRYGWYCVLGDLKSHWSLSLIDLCMIHDLQSVLPTRTPEKLHGKNTTYNIYSSQCSQLYGFSPVWVLTCLIREAFTLKPCWQWSQTKGFSPVWVLRCLTRLDFSVNPRWQWSQIKGRSPVCVLTWLIREVFTLKPRWQCSHLNGFSPVCVLRCLFMWVEILVL